jgi:hypothetical protein
MKDLDARECGIQDYLFGRPMRPRVVENGVETYLTYYGDLMKQYIEGYYDKKTEYDEVE